MFQQLDRRGKGGESTLEREQRDVKMREVSKK